MKSINDIAQESRKDAERLDYLQSALQIIGMNPDEVDFRIECNFPKIGAGWKGGELFSEYVYSEYGVIRVKVMERAAKEIADIEAKYAPLMGGQP